MKRLELPGMIFNESNSDYHANKAVSFSNLKTLIKSPELFKKDVLDGLIEHESKDAWDIGNAVHCEILEPHKFDAEYKFAPEGYKGTTKEGKALKAECVEKGITLLNAANSIIAKNCIASLKANADIMKLFAQGDPEITWRKSYEAFSVQCRTDWFCHSAPAGLEMWGVNEGDAYVPDLKTTRNLDDWLSDSRWKNPLTNDLFYSGQDAYYRGVMENIVEFDKPLHFLFVVVEKAEPFRSHVFKSPEEVFNWANDTVTYAITDLISRNKSNDWTDERLNGIYEPFIYIDLK